MDQSRRKLSPQTWVEHPPRDGLQMGHPLTWGLIPKLPKEVSTIVASLDPVVRKSDTCTIDNTTCTSCMSVKDTKLNTFIETKPNWEFEKHNQKYLANNVTTTDVQFTVTND